MENLENKSSEGKPLGDSSGMYMPLYKGLELLEEKNFKGGTSVKYWM